MRFPVDVSALTFRVAVPPREVLDFESGKPKTRPDGTAQWRVGLMAMDGSEAELIRVNVPGPLTLAVDESVSVVGMSCLHWSMGDRSGMSFSADRIAAAKPAASSGSASGGAK
ncbi:hypothetical protein CLV63_1529 [Murinocardiopsis flavida]|uniref:Uncharacterized protein n=1 Tax=Murinocardiopsis flavida TaxID=645275 RepID=A0A2P8C6W2_9ACTN|nr:hypothetical protein [Murinocardiopsis flavida]PSK80702.1 hypothetical protein CLV63_1529 [Murinocardiopsis flavida]